MQQRWENVEELTTVGSSDNPFVTKFVEFFENVYKNNIRQLSESYPQKRSFDVDFRELEHFDPELADELLENSDYVIEAATQAISQIDIPRLDLESFTPHIRFFNLPKDRQPLIRDISASHLNKLVAVEGIIRQFNEVQPKLHIAVWQCRRCGNTYKMEQEGFTVQQPAICECKYKDFQLLEEQSTFINHQKIAIQEPLEHLKGGEQATALDVHVTDDLVNKVSPGDKTTIVGILRLYPPKERKAVYGRYLEALHLEEKEKEFKEMEISKEEVEQIRELASRDDIYHLLVQSIAPAIYGHETIKEAISLQLFSGVRKQLPGGARIRGNIHVLLVGDPGLAKSQMLMSVDRIAPKSIYVGGKTTSGVGLTASAEKDEFGEGGWTLKAGALVLANGGVVMVDEFDKMDPQDRSAMHEALEQEQVSIAKAGIVTTFKTETSVLAAANPKYARFDPFESPLSQVDLPPTLISRFDLFFLMKDVLDRKKDEDIATHILKTHQAGEIMLQASRTENAAMQQKALQVQQMVTPVVDVNLLRRYISFARQNIFPILSDEGMKNLLEFYLDLREQGKKEGHYAATHRQLEALVRLSEASARIKLKDIVEKEDTDRAIRLFKLSLQEMAVDSETGKIDIDIIAAGMPHSQVTQMKKLLNIVKDLSTKSENGSANINEILEQAKVDGMDSDKAQDLLKKLKQKGDLYEPRHGQLKPTQRSE